MVKSYKKRFQMFSEFLSAPELVNYARKDGHNTFSRKRKMSLKDMLLCCLSKKGLTTAFELRNFFKDKGELPMALSVQGYLQQRKRRWKSHFKAFFCASAKNTSKAPGTV